LTAAPRFGERALVFLLRLSGCLTLSAFLAMVMPAKWMAAVHERLGFGPFPETPVMIYLSRTIAALYGMHGIFVWLVASDVRRHRLFAAYAAWATASFGVLALWIDLGVGMPLWWTVGEGPVLLCEGALMLYFLRSVPRAVVS
jgi:hypothetical protein